jgi:tetraacyldisaccharide 4'-kinase
MAVAYRSLHDWTLEWWAGRKGFAGRALDSALLPAETLYRVVSSSRNAAYEHGWLRREHAPIPVVSIGNLTVGGVGKTPFSAWAAGQLSSWGRAPAIVLRGYGADEALVHAELNPGLPVYTAARRIEAVVRAARAGCDVAVLDDGFQHRSLERDLDLVLLSAESWSERRRLLPRGPWRESITALGRASLVVVTRKWATPARALEVAAAVREARPGGPVATCHLAPTGLAPLHGSSAAERPPEWIRGRSALAVASLGDPGAFARQLEMMGAQVELMAFPDHHEFGAADACSIVDRAAGRTIVMTRKEAVKLRPLLPSDSAAVVVGQRVVLESEAGAVLAALRRAVGS